MQDGVAHLLDFVRDSDVPCPVCAYNLRNLTEPRCPECGEPLRLRIVLAEPRLKLWLAMLIPLLAATGIGLLFCYLIIRKGLPNAPGGKPPVLAFATIVPLGAVALFSRLWFARQSLARQRWLAGITPILVIALFIWAILAVR